MDLLNESRSAVHFKRQFEHFFEVVNDIECNNYYGLTEDLQTMISCGSKQVARHEFESFKFYLEVIKINKHLYALIEACKPENLNAPCREYISPTYDSDQVMNPHNYQPPSIVESNSQLCAASSSVKLIVSERYGRCLQAAKKIKFGDVIVYEQAGIMANIPNCVCFVNPPRTIQRCYTCAIPMADREMYTNCTDCKIVETCAVQDCNMTSVSWYHKYECYGLLRHFWSPDLSDPAYLSMRMMLYGAMNHFDVGSSAQGKQGSHALCCSYAAFYNLETHIHENDPIESYKLLNIIAKTMIYLVQCTEFFNDLAVNLPVELNKYQLFVFVGGIMYRHICQVMSNAVYLDLPNYNLSKINEVTERRIRAICPVISYINHSCTPNAALVFYDDTVIVKAIRDIKVGEQIFIAYKDIKPHIMLPTRQEKSVFQYRFLCNCDLCSEQILFGDRVLKCVHCTSGKVKVFPKDNLAGLKTFMFHLVSRDFSKKKEILSLVESISQDQSGTTKKKKKKKRKGTSEAAKKDEEISKDHLPDSVQPCASAEQAGEAKLSEAEIMNNSFQELEDEIARLREEEATGLVNLCEPEASAMNIQPTLQIHKKKREPFIERLLKIKESMKTLFLTNELAKLHIVPNSTMCEVIQYFNDTKELVSIVYRVRHPKGSLVIYDDVLSSSKLKKTSKPEETDDMWWTVIEFASGYGTKVIVYSHDLASTQSYAFQGYCGDCLKSQDVSNKVKILEYIDILRDNDKFHDQRLFVELVFKLCELVLHPDCTEMNKVLSSMYEMEVHTNDGSKAIDYAMRLIDMNIKRFGYYYFPALVNDFAMQDSLVMATFQYHGTSLNKDYFVKLKHLFSKMKLTVNCFKLYAPMERVHVMVCQVEKLERDQLKWFKKKMNENTRRL